MKKESAGTDYLLTNEDRCDACDAQAYIHVAFESGDLLFCLHHWKLHKDKAEGTALDVYDESERLLIR